MNTRLIVLLLVLASTVLAGCAGPRSVSNDVSSFGDWPAGRAPGSFAFDRLPSQQALGAETDRVEAAALPALQRAGFVPATDAQAADVLVQVATRSKRSDTAFWGEPAWFHGGVNHWRWGPWFGPTWIYVPAHEFPRFEREVAVLIRDRATGRSLFEARATSEGTAATDDVLLAAMFEATLMDFPRQGVNPRRVVVPVAP
jgi:predicted small secreted protein